MTLNFNKIRFVQIHTLKKVNSLK